MENALEKLQEWYVKQCNGDWEHEFGIKIDTIDNPGWVVSVDLLGTPLQEKVCISVNKQISPNNWIQCETINDQFIGYGGPNNLKEIIEEFLKICKCS